jgi:hypothetical protein
MAGFVWLIATLAQTGGGTGQTGGGNGDNSCPPGVPSCQPPLTPPPPLTPSVPGQLPAGNPGLPLGGNGGFSCPPGVPLFRCRAPPPPLPPLPPYVPGLCSNTCVSAFDGECDDLGFSESSCLVGTDCSDCGSIEVAACSTQDVHNPCLVRQVGNDVCDDECNFIGCSHDDGDCSLEEVISDRASHHPSRHSGQGTTSVAIGVHLNSIALIIDDMTGKTYAQFRSAAIELRCNLHRAR